MGRRFGAVMLVIGLVGLLIVIASMLNIINPGLFRPKSRVVGSFEVRPLQGVGGKEVFVSAKLTSTTVLKEVLIKEGGRVVAKVVLDKLLKAPVTTFAFRFPWRAGHEYELEFYSAGMVLIGRATLRCPDIPPSFAISNLTISYGLVPTSEGVRQVIYALFDVKAVEVSRVLVTLWAAPRLGPVPRKVLVVTTGFGYLSKTLTTDADAIVRLLRDHGIEAYEVSAAEVPDYVGKSARGVVLVVTDVIPSRLLDYLPSFVASGGILVAITPWLGKYVLTPSGVLYISENPHPEEMLLGRQVVVFEDTPIRVRASVGLYNSTITLLATRPSPNAGFAFVSSVGRGFVVWIPTKLSGVPRADLLIYSLVTTCFWNRVEGGSYRQEVLNLDYDLVKRSFLIMVPIQQGFVKVQLSVCPWEGECRFFEKTIYVPPVIKG